MMKRSYTLVLAVLLPIFSTYAQTAKWCIKPEYSEITLFGEDLFKCVDRTGKVQLIDWNGSELLHNVDADSLTDYDGGYALVLKHVGNRNQILGFISEKKPHVYKTVSGEYFTARYSFFSEECLAVADRNGKQGYLDVNGDVVKDCVYLEAMPFRYGWAAVMKGGKDKTKPYAYVSLQRNDVNGIDGLGDFTLATTFNEEGIALVKSYGRYAFINKNFVKIQRKAEKSDMNSLRSYDNSYTEGDKNWTPRNSIPKPDGNIEICEKDGLFGYTKGGVVVLPHQFSEAQPFCQGHAIVKKDGKYGVLELLEGKVVANWPKESFRVYPDGKCNLLHFELEVPSSLESGNIELEMDEGNGTYKKNVPLAYDLEPDSYRGTNQCMIRGKAVCDGLLLWEDSKKYEVNEITIDIKTPFATSKYADENSNQTVKTVVTNTSDVDVMVDATLNVSGQTTHFRQTLKPKQSKPLIITVKVTEDKDVQAAVSVKSDGHNCGSKTIVLSLKTI